MQRMVLLAAAMVMVASLLVEAPAWASSKLLVSDVSPDGDATGVTADSNITAKFNKAMKASTIKGSTFYLTKEGSSTTLPAKVSYSGTSKTATLDPNSDLEDGTTYTATISGVRSSKGGRLSGTADNTATFANSKLTWSFTVRTTGANPTVSSVTPTDGARNVASDTLPTATFSEDMDPSTITPQNFILTKGGSPVAAQAGYDSATKKATLTPDSPLEENTTYTATISKNVKDKAGRALEQNYMWSFTIADTTRPSVSSVTPKDGATDVATNTNVEATFSEAMDSNSITSQTFTLSKDGSPVAAHVRYDGTSKKAILDPDSDLEENTTYTATNTTGAKDKAGNALEQDYTWSFKTAPDTIPPTVSSVTPADKATEVPINTNLTATFSEGMDPNTVTNRSFTLSSKSGSSVSAQVTYDENSLTATLDPDQNLENGTPYEAKITTSAKDLAGNAITQEKTWGFTTAKAGVTITPSTLNFSPEEITPWCNIVSKNVTVTNNGPGDITFANVSISGQDASNFSDGAASFIASNGAFTVLAGNHFFDPVTFRPGPSLQDRHRLYEATLTYTDETGATINSVQLAATTQCINV